MKRGAVVALHAGYWLLYLSLLAVLFATLRLQLHRGPSPWTTLLASRIGLMAIVPNVVAFYLAYALLFPLLARRRTVALLLCGALGAVGSVALVALGLYAALGAELAPFSDVRELALLLGSLGAVASIHMAAALGMRGFVTWYGDLQAKEELQRRTHEVEMALVRSKIDPHFLFNTLNNIDVLITKDPDAASSYLHKLSEILRFVLYETGAETIPLAEELAYVDKYIALERIRSASPRYVECEVAGDPAGYRIAPMVFLPFLENAFKHAEGRKTDEAIVIRFVIEGDRLTFRCENRHRRAERPAREAAGGLGNELTRRRLALLYPGRHALEISDHDDTYTVLLRMDLHAPALPRR